MQALQKMVNCIPAFRDKHPAGLDCLVAAIPESDLIDVHQNLNGIRA